MISAIGGVSALDSLNAVYEVSSYTPSRRTSQTAKQEPRPIPEDTAEISDAALAAFDRSSLNPVAAVARKKDNGSEDYTTAELSESLSSDDAVQERIRQIAGARSERTVEPTSSENSNETEESEESSENTGSKKYEDLSEEEKKEVDKLKQRDTEVKAHEQAHLSAAGDLANGGAQFSYQTGPDGTRYAVGGEVSINTSKGKTPEETIQKAVRIRQAAMAPAEPSGQDRSVAAKADQMKAQATNEIQKKSAQKLSDSNKKEDSSTENESEIPGVPTENNNPEKPSDVYNTGSKNTADISGITQSRDTSDPASFITNSAESSGTEPSAVSNQYQNNSSQSLDFMKAFTAYSQAGSFNSLNNSTFSFAA